MSWAHKIRYTSRAAAAAAAVKKLCADAAERLAARERAGEGAGVLEAIPVPAGDPEGAGDDGD